MEEAANELINMLMIEDEEEENEEDEDQEKDVAEESKDCLIRLLKCHTFGGTVLLY